MKVLLDHMSVPVHDRASTAQFYASVFGVSTDGPRSRSGWVALSDGLSLILEEGEVPGPRHYAFRVEMTDFRTTVERVRDLGIPFGTSSASMDGQIKSRPDRSHSIYFHDPNGHSLELITQEP
jgi:extradiol dioxygenase family protein